MLRDRLLIIGLLLCIATPLFANERVVRIVNSPWQPYFADELPHHGMVGEIITQAYQSSGFTVQFMQVPWPRAMKWIAIGKADAAATAYYTPARAKLFQFSQPYMTSPVVIFKKKNDFIQWESIRDLMGYDIGIISGNSYSLSFDTADELQKHIFYDETQLLKVLVKGRVDMVLLDKYVGAYLLSKKLPEYLELIDVAPRPLAVNPLHLLFSRQSDNVDAKLEAFNNGLNKIRDNGELARILNKYGFAKAHE